MSLISNIFSDYIGGHFISDTANEIPIVPEFARPHLLPQFRVFFNYFSCRYTFHYLHYLCRRIFWRYFDKYMNMIFQYFHGIYSKFILLCYFYKYLFSILRYLVIQYMLSVFRYPHYMIFKVVNGMLCPFYPHAVFISGIEPFGNYFLPRRQTAFIPLAS